MISLSKPIISIKEIAAVKNVLKSGLLAQGEKVRILEEKFSQYCKMKHAVAFNSGTAAIHAGLYALGIQPGDEVITTPFTFVATANPICMLGAKVIFTDISEKDFNIDPAGIEKKITKKTKAVIPVDLYGQIYNYARINSIAKKYNLKILEDACQSIGASQNGKKSGNFGNIAAFSLYATKNIMCGEGGLITTNDSKIAEKCKLFRHHGQSEKTRYEYWDLGYNYRMTDLAAAIAIEQLKKLDIFNKKRIRNAEKLSAGLKNIKGLLLPRVMEGNMHVFHQYTIRITNQAKYTRDELMQFLNKNKIGCGVYYPKPLHLHPYFRKMGYKEGDFPLSEKLSKEVLSLPVHPRLGLKDINYIIKAIKYYAK